MAAGRLWGFAFYGEQREATPIQSWNRPSGRTVFCTNYTHYDV